jgi:hypothetical protein
MDLGDQGTGSRAKYEFIDRLPASKPRGIHAAKEHHLAPQEQALASTASEEVAPPQAKGLSDGAPADTRLAFTDTTAGTELIVREASASSSQDPQVPQGEAPWPTSNPLEHLVVDRQFSWGDPLTAPSSHAQDQTPSATAPLALPPSDSAPAPAYRTRFTREAAPLPAGEGREQLQAAATAMPTEWQRRVEDKLIALGAALVHAEERCAGAEERCELAENAVAGIRSQLRAAVQGIDHLADETEALRTQARAADMAIAGAHSSLESLFAALRIDIKNLDGRDLELVERVTKVER